VSIADRVPQRLRAQYRRLSRLRWAKKARNLCHYGADLRSEPLRRARYVLWDPEIDNFTYDIANRDELAAFVAGALGVDCDRVAAHIAELDGDAEFARRLREGTAGRFASKRSPQLGRRLGWYAIARILKPEVAIETGIHDGLGSLVLLTALRRNGEEGSPGVLLSFDPLPGTGWIVPDELRAGWEPYFERSEAMVERLRGRRVGLFLHDSLHTYAVERAEIEDAWQNRAEGCVLLSDNAHVTTALRDAADEHGLRYSYFQERPRGHFYPGGGIGLAAS
jgi:hypothetical protein